MVNEDHTGKLDKLQCRPVLITAMASMNFAISQKEAGFQALRLMAILTLTCCWQTKYEMLIS